MEAIAAGVAGWLLALSALYLAQRWYDKKRAAEQRESLQAVASGMALMTAMQQHRGMAAALLSGDASFAGRLAGKQQDVERALTALDDSFTRIRMFALLARRLEEIRSGWRKLCQQVQSLSPEKSFAAHTELVQLVLYLLGDMGERGGLLEAHAPELAAMADALLLRIPPLTESIGQARALGTGFAAKGGCGAVGRVRLNFLLRRIRDGLDGALSEHPRLAARAQECRYKVNALLVLIETRLVGVEQVDLAPDFYFRSATEAIDACLALWQAGEQVMRNELLAGTATTIAEPGTAASVRVG
jgi:hypothetical protein